MMRRFSGYLLWLLISTVLPILLGCGFFFPAKIERTSLLIAKEGRGDSYTIGKDGTTSYTMEGLRIDIKHMTDRELNEFFPEESNQGEYSINPYTYGDYVDPAAGYVRNRFTVFRVTVHNASFAKLELDPLRAVLITDRGEGLHPYGISSGSAPRSFESYYRAMRGPSGNEYYRFNMRMGTVRSNNYGVDEKIFKGETYGGFIVFDPLDDEVKGARLILADFVLKFNAFDKPLQTTDVVFDFDRNVTQQVVEDQKSLASSHEMTRATLSASSQVVGNVAGDATRDVSAIDAVAKVHLSDINRCFEKEFGAGTASEGQVTVTFVILPIGAVESAHVVASTVGSDAVEECIVNQITQWKFKPSTGQVTEIPRESEAERGVSAPAEPLQAILSSRVTATCSFEFVDIRTESSSEY